MSGIRFTTERNAVGEEYLLELFSVHGRGTSYRGLLRLPPEEAAAFEAMVVSHEACIAALEATLPQAYGCWANHYGDNPEGSSEPEYIEMIRAALALARPDAEGEPK